MIITFSLELLERGGELPIIPLSLGMVREDGERLYLINGELPLSQLARHPWIQHNVVPYLPITMSFSATMDSASSIIEWDANHPDYAARVNLDEMRNRVIEFTHVDKPQLWSYYASYAHVALGQLFGTRDEWPAHLPQHVNELVQYWDSVGRPQLPRQPLSIHHALHDAQWNMEVYWAISEAEMLGAGKLHDPEDVLIEHYTVEVVDDGSESQSP